MGMMEVSIHAWRSARRRTAIDKNRQELLDLRARCERAERELDEWRQWWRLIESNKVFDTGKGELYKESNKVFDIGKKENVDQVLDIGKGELYKESNKIFFIEKEDSVALEVVPENQDVEVPVQQQVPVLSSVPEDEVVTELDEEPALCGRVRSAARDRLAAELGAGGWLVHAVHEWCNGGSCQGQLEEVLKKYAATTVSMMREESDKSVTEDDLVLAVGCGMATIDNWCCSQWGEAEVMEALLMIGKEAAGWLGKLSRGELDLG